MVYFMPIWSSIRVKCYFFTCTSFRIRNNSEKESGDPIDNTPDTVRYTYISVCDNFKSIIARGLKLVITAE